MTEQEKMAGMSFEDNQKRLLTQLQASSSSNAVEKKIPFHNEDVSSFLEKLQEFGRRSREISLIVR